MSPHVSAPKPAAPTAPARAQPCSPPGPAPRGTARPRQAPCTPGAALAAEAAPDRTDHRRLGTAARALSYAPRISRHTHRRPAHTPPHARGRSQERAGGGGGSGSRRESRSVCSERAGGWKRWRGLPPAQTGNPAADEPRRALHVNPLLTAPGSSPSAAASQRSQLHAVLGYSMNAVRSQEYKTKGNKHVSYHFASTRQDLI